MWYAALAAYQVFAGGAQADAVMRNSRIQQRINGLNAQYVEKEAYDAEVMGYTEAARYQNVIDTTVADQRVGYASKDVDVNYGTAADVQAETRLTGALNIIDIEQRARQKALGLKREASNIRLGGSMNELQSSANAASAREQGLFSAAMTGLSGYSRASTTTKTPVSEKGIG